jgi:hypothetical protein
MGRCMKFSTWSKAGQNKRKFHSNTVEKKSNTYPYVMLTVRSGIPSRSEVNLTVPDTCLLNFYY